MITLAASGTLIRSSCPTARLNLSHAGSCRNLQVWYVFREIVLALTKCVSTLSLATPSSPAKGRGRSRRLGRWGGGGARPRPGSGDGSWTCPQQSDHCVHSKQSYFGQFWGEIMLVLIPEGHQCGFQRLMGASVWGSNTLITTRPKRSFFADTVGWEF